MSRAIAARGATILQAFGVWAGLLLAWGTAWPVAAAESPTSQPAVQQESTVPSRLDSLELTRSNPSLVKRDGTPAQSGGDSFSLWRVLLAMAVVLAAVFGLRWLGQRFLGLPGTVQSSGPVQVLCRSALSPRQQLVLIQVGRRLVLAASSGAQVSPLCEITDPEEIAQLTGQVRNRRPDSVAGSFMAFFGRANTPYDASEPTPPSGAEAPAETDGDSAAVAEARQEITGLSEKIRALAQAMRRT